MTKAAPTKAKQPSGKPGPTKSISKTGSMKANEDILEGLQKLLRKNQLEKQRGKVMAYTKAIASIRGLKVPIKSIADVKGLEGVGSGIQKKVQEYLDNGKFRDV